MAAEVVVWKNIKKVFEENKRLTEEWNSLQELQESVIRARYAMEALEERNTMTILDEDDPINNRIRNLGALLYQADDLLDEILMFFNGSSLATGQNADPGENQRVTQQEEAGTCSRITRTVSLVFSTQNPIVFTFKWGQKIRKINKKIKGHVKQLKNEVGSNVNTQIEFEPTGDFTLAENKVIGRDSDKKAIIKMLLQPKAENETNVSVIPIVGSPGLGKTVLAKYVYDDQTVNKHFDLKIWIRVSHITNDADVIREIVEACTNRKSNDYRFSKQENISRSQFCDVLGCQSFDRSVAVPRGTTRTTQIDICESRLRKEIKGKLFLLVLDDASIMTWQHLKKILGGGARGSHILVTTRSTDVANLSKTASPDDIYKLGELGEKESRRLFNDFAFLNGGQRAPELEEIGDCIAKKCKGVPLTIKVAASMLHKKDKNGWLSFDRRMNGVDRIMKHVLDCSYNDLPTRLKACFAYCSLFPEDHIFNKHDLISLWTAQGYVDQQHGQNKGHNLEERAEKYFLELSRRCFFEDMSTDDLGNIITCKMHPIMHKLAGHYATGVMGLYVLNSSVKQALDPEYKHISFACVAKSSTKLAPSLIGAKNLRTLLSVKESDDETEVQRSLCDMLMSSLICLRVLDLHDLGIEELPDSIGKLIHLRYLDLSKNGLVIFPKSVTELLNLQTLKLNSCVRLKRLLGNFGQLINLKRFEVDECDSLTCMPLGIERLTQLETLSRFIVKDCSAELGALRCLTSLQGRLAIELSGNWATTIPKNPQAELKTKIQLEELKISWAKPVPDNHSYQKLLEQLQPNMKLKILYIEGYKGEDFPSWIKRDMLTCLPNLVVVSIEGCSASEYLPPFSELPSLKRLTLRHMTNVQYVEEASQESPTNTSQKPMLSSLSFFQSLEELTLQNFYKLEGWRKEMMVTSEKQEEIRSFPRLKKLRIWNCPNLKYMPLFTGVLDIGLRNVNQMLLEECARKVSKHQLINKFQIKHLKIKECRNLENFEAVRKGLGGLSILKELVVERCDALYSLASELKHLTSLESLEISGCKELNLSDNRIGAAANSSPLSWISSKIVCPRSAPWASLRSLRHLTLREIQKMETLPEGLQHARNLRTLWISACHNLKALPEWISCLTTLQHLRIESCPSLTRLPDGIKKVRSLIKVEITDSEKLMERCKVHTGEDWHKIKHAWVLLHKSWRYGLMSELGASQKKSNLQATTDVKYYITIKKKSLSDT